MKTIGILSDTHAKMNDMVLEVLSGNYSKTQVFDYLDIEGDGATYPPAECDLILHAGDIGYADMPTQWILDRLEEIAPVIAVAGNCDYPDRYLLNGKELPQYAAFSEDGVSFAMLHTPTDLNLAIRGNGVLSPAYIKPMPDVLIHGHTHVLEMERRANGTVMLCPGSPSKPRGDNPPSVLVMKIEDGHVLSVEAVSVAERKV